MVFNMGMPYTAIINLTISHYDIKCSRQMLTEFEASPATGHPPAQADELADFSTNHRVLLMSAMSLAIGAMSALVAYVLLNQIRRTNPALQSDLSLHFHPVDNPQIIAYSKSVTASEETPANVILVVVNLDPQYEQSGWVDLDLKQLGIAHNQTFEVEDLLTGNHYLWHDRSNFVVLHPTATAHIFRITCSRPM